MGNSSIIKVIITVVIFWICLGTQDNLFPAISGLHWGVYGALFLLLIFSIYVPISEQGRKTKGFILVGIILFAIAFIFGGSRPSSLNAQEKQYIQHFDSGYECFRSRNYDCALKEYELAENLFDTDVELYVRRAWVYENLKEYKKAINEAEKALTCDENHSIYKKAKGYRFGSQNSISIYTTLGDCYYKLKQYKEAKEAFNYVVNNVTYMYSDAYYKRGKCEYYLGEKQEALADFYKHKQVINSYLEAQANSEYPAKYPTYNKQDLIRLEKWIISTKALQ